METIATPALSPESVTACRDRLARLSGGLAKRGLDALLVSGEIDIRYLTGFVGHDSLLLVHGGTGVIVSDARYDEFLDPWRSGGSTEVVMGTRHRLPAAVADLCVSHGLAAVGIQSEQVTISAREQLASALGEDRLVPTSGVVGSLRVRKDDLEVRMIERAIRCHQEAIAAALPRLQIDMTEQAFSATIEYEMKTRGASGASFEPIVGSGANSSVIHHLTGATSIAEGALLVDWGAAVDGYCSDMTRTFGVGSMPDAIRTIYPIVLEAQLAAIDACRPGEPCAAIDAVARRIITEAGYGDRFGHGLGHGLGMDVHEPPYFNDLSTDILLEPGMVMTVEPGIYLPGVGGVRIEDDILITEGGCRVLGDWPKDIDAMIIEPARANGSGTRDQ